MLLVFVLTVHLQERMMSVLLKVQLANVPSLLSVYGQCVCALHCTSYVAPISVYFLGFSRLNSSLSRYGPQGGAGLPFSTCNQIWRLKVNYITTRFFKK